MDFTSELDAPCPPAELFAWVEDLARYPTWLGIVTRAEREPGAEAAWSVDLRARFGRLARSKRLRMVRTAHEPVALAVFERAETDGRRHSRWALRAEVSPTPGGSRLAMHLHYGGAFWGPVLERLLADEVVASRSRLLELVSA